MRQQYLKLFQKYRFVNKRGFPCFKILLEMPKNNEKLQTIGDFNEI